MPKYEILGSDDSDSRVQCAIALHAALDMLSDIADLLEVMRLAATHPEMPDKSHCIAAVCTHALSILECLADNTQWAVQTLVPECPHNDEEFK